MGVISIKFTPSLDFFVLDVRAALLLIRGKPNTIRSNIY
jgi:hypothetical protein